MIKTSSKMVLTQYDETTGDIEKEVILLPFYRREIKLHKTVYYKVFSKNKCMILVVKKSGEVHIAIKPFITLQDIMPRYVLFDNISIDTYTINANIFNHALNNIIIKIKKGINNDQESNKTK